MPSKESAGPGLNLSSKEVCKQPTQAFIPLYSWWLINEYFGKPVEGKLWYPGCHTCPLSHSNGLLPISANHRQRWSPRPRAHVHILPTLPMHAVGHQVIFLIHNAKVCKTFISENWCFNFKVKSEIGSEIIQKSSIHLCSLLIFICLVILVFR